MKCPHCEADKSKVLSTRTDSSGIYRRRYCLACGGAFVSVETAPVGLKMPTSAEHKSRLKEAKRKPGQGAFQTDHLTGIW